jgi:hypothetical protein
MVSRERKVGRPIVKTYLSVDSDQTIHARVYSPSYNLDRKGSGPTIEKAVSQALLDVPVAKKIRKRK